MSNPLVPTILATNEHFIRCSIQTRGLRMLDHLNDPTRDYVEVEAVSIFRRMEPNPLATFDRSVLDKKNIAIAIPAMKKHEAPTKRANAYTEKRIFRAFVVAAGYEIRGAFQSTDYQDAAAVLRNHDKEFIPLPEASINYGSTREKQPENQVILVNSRWITIMHVDAPEPVDFASAISDIIKTSP